MAKVIYDTNIWYSIAKGDNLNLHTNHSITVTYNNIDEVSISHNLIRNFDYLRSVIICMFKNHQYVIIKNPIEYLINLCDKQYFNEDYKKHYDEILYFTQQIARNTITSKYFETIELKNHIDFRKKELKEISDVFMAPMNKLKMYIEYHIKRGNLTKDKYWKQDLSEFTKYLTTDLVKSITPENYTLPQNYPWQKIELFLGVFERYLKEIVIAKKVVKENDWYDLFGLIYVQPGDKYFTYEKYWLRLINDCNLNHYLL